MHNFQLDIVRDLYLRSSHSTHRWLAPLAVFFFVCLAVGLAFTKYAFKSPRAPLTYEAISSIIVPAICAHPEQYQPLLRHSAADNVIRLDFVDFWKHIAYGHIELKDTAALGELCLDQAYAFGQSVSFSFDWTWRGLVLWQVFASYLAFCWEHLMRRKEISKDKMSEIPNLGSCLVDETLDLDFIPLPYIGAALLVAKSQLTPNESFDIEFTCLGSATTFTSYWYWLCAAILLPVQHNISTSKKTALPFFISLPSVIHDLSSSYVVIQTVKDISDVHAKALEVHADDMVADKWMRSSFVARHGLDAWRETGLRLKWEAALLKTNVLVRWKITMSNPKRT